MTKRKRRRGPRPVLNLPAEPLPGTVRLVTGFPFRVGGTFHRIVTDRQLRQAVERAREKWWHANRPPGH